VPLAELPEDETPLAELPEDEVPLAELPEEDVPLSDVPMTGDNGLLWTVVLTLSGLGLVYLVISGKKREVC
jgi:LPXTG-motif cell wall-anchored protein